MPATCLANDMMVFYALREIYVEQMTVMEMICSSVCVTSMICFSMEVKYGHMLDCELHMHGHRVGARGNVTSFPMPWQALLAELQRLDAERESKNSPCLPHTGRDLANVVQVLLKTSRDEVKEAGVSSFIHQARVRRHVVVKAILEAKRRGHRAYVLVDEAAVRNKAQELPEAGVPPEVLRLLPLDNHLDKLQVQKAATPVEGRRNIGKVGDAFAKQRPQAVVLEKSANEQADINAQQIHVLRHVAEILEDPRAETQRCDHKETEDEHKRKKRKPAQRTKKVNERALDLHLQSVRHVVQRNILVLASAALTIDDQKSLIRSCRAHAPWNEERHEEALSDVERDLFRLDPKA